LGEVLGRFLAPADRLGDFPEALALGCEGAELARLVGFPRLLVPLEKLLRHQSAFAFFFAPVFLGGAFFFAGALRPFFFAGPLAARASISSIAWASVTSSGLTSLGI